MTGAPGTLLDLVIGIVAKAAELARNGAGAHSNEREHVAAIDRQLRKGGGIESITFGAIGGLEGEAEAEICARSREEKPIRRMAVFMHRLALWFVRADRWRDQIPNNSYESGGP
jgi:hypothetical protein